MALKRLILHLGTPKTGTTSLQNTLVAEEEKLATMGVRYLKSNRAAINHNHLIHQLSKEGETVETATRNLRRELDHSEEHTILISAEIAYGLKPTMLLLNAIGQKNFGATEIIIYVRRQDLLLEAMAKQKLKSGHYQGNLEDFIATRKQTGRYLSYISDVKERFPNLAITCRPYDRRELVDGDIITDFWQYLDLPYQPRKTSTEGPKNITPCRELAIALSCQEFSTPQFRRKVIDDIQSSQPNLFKSKDILDANARRALQEEFRQENKALGAYCGRDIEALFNDNVDYAAESNPVEDPVERKALLDLAKDRVRETVQRLHQIPMYEAATHQEESYRGGAPQTVRMTQNSKIIAEYKGFKVPDSPFAKRTGESRFRDGKYERKELEIGMALLKDGDRILEMGAGLGFVGGFLAFDRPSVELWSFEANPNLISHIEEMYTLNGINSRARVSNNVVLTGEDLPATVPFHIYNCYLGSSLFDREDKPRPSVDVPTCSWMDIQSNYKPTFLMMDIEGGELDFLEGAILDGIETVVIEFHPNRYEIAGMRRCKRLLRHAGFEPNAKLSTQTVWGCSRTSAI